MSASLVNRVRGEQIPLGENHLRLLEVIVDEHETPMWRARCLQTGNLLNVALDGFVKVSEPLVIKPSSQVPHDYVGERKRARRLRRWVFSIGSLLLAGLALLFPDTALGWLKSLKEFVESGIRQIR